MTLESWNSPSNTTPSSATKRTRATDLEDLTIDTANHLAEENSENQDNVDKEKSIRVNVTIEKAKEQTCVGHSLTRSHKRTKKENDVKEELVGSHVKVWWPLDQQYYEGIIESYDPVKKKHKVAYFDGDVEHLILKKERWSRVDTSDTQNKDKGIRVSVRIEGADEKTIDASDDVADASDDIADVSNDVDKSITVAVRFEGAKEKTVDASDDVANASDDVGKSIRVCVRIEGEEKTVDASDDVADVSDVQIGGAAEKTDDASDDVDDVLAVQVEGAEEGKGKKIPVTDREGNVSDVEREKGEYIGVEDDDEMNNNSNHDGLDEMWAMMNSVWIADCEDPFGSSSSYNPSGDGLHGDARDCDHSFIFREDVGSVCRVCGLIEKEIGSIIDYQFVKSKKSGRTYSQYERTREGRSDETIMVPDGTQLDEAPVEVFVHPRHKKVMKDHQYEGVKFLSGNLMIDNPGGCVMAHAPGSGKTFMIVSFLQMFMTKYPAARPLIVLPRGIVSTWKQEFKKWQVEDIPLYDFYSVKADNRRQQLDVLQKWGSERSVLFLSYRQFTVIVCDAEMNSTTRSCQNFLLETPSVLILDEGHTPRNDDTETLTSLQKVKTPRKVVLSGTLYQNHVKEVFNVLNLARPNFLKTNEARSIKRRIMSKVTVLGERSAWTDDTFYEAVERTILDDIKFRRKVHIIQDLRDMTRKFLHYYKGDSLDELPGLVDFTVSLKLSEKQKEAIEVLTKCKNKFKIISEGSAIYVHPRLNSVMKQSGRIDVEKMDDLLLEDMSEVGAKAKFYLNLLHLCESTGEKLLVFSQYLGPLKFLERLTVKLKNYSVGKEMFVITGDSDADIRDSSMEQFNTSSQSRVLFGSIKACGEGISLVGASRVIIMDVHLNPSVTRQAVGRAFRPGQQRKVYTYRLVSSASPEEEDHLTCFRKECIAKMWFEWNEYQGLDVFEMEAVDVNSCGDSFLENERLKADIVSVYKR